MLKTYLIKGFTGKLIRMPSASRRAVALGGAVLLLTALAPAASAQAADELRALRKEVEALKTGQQEMRKNLQIVKDILMGKQPPLEDVYVSTADAPTLGEKTAKLTLVEFSDYQCPFCARYSNETFSKIMDEYVKTGKVRYVFKDFPLESLHPTAAKVAEAAKCAGEQGKFWEAHERFFKNQKALSAQEMKGHATVLELDTEKFQQCYDSGKYAAKVRQEIAEGQKLGIRGTPMFYIGFPDPKNPTRISAVKSLSGAQPFTAFKDAIDNLLNPPKPEKEGNASEE